MTSLEMPGEEEEQDEEKAGEVPTTFATKGMGWSGRDDSDEDDPLT